MTWIRETDTKLHAVDLKATSQEKKEQLEILKVSMPFEQYNKVGNTEIFLKIMTMNYSATSI
jgi:hypothetical protein